MDFSKKVSKVTDFRWLFGAKILDFFIQDFQPNLEVFAKIEIFEIFFIQDFQPNLEVFAKIEIFIFKRISSQKRASLARPVSKPSMRQSCTYCAEAFKLFGWYPVATRDLTLSTSSLLVRFPNLVSVPFLKGFPFKIVCF